MAAKEKWLAVFERQQGHLDQALTTLSTALAKFPKFGKLYMMQGQIHQSRNNYPSARASYATDRDELTTTWRRGTAATYSGYMVYFSLFF